MGSRSQGGGGRRSPSGRTALLAGESDILAVTVDDDQPTAFDSLGRNKHGDLDPADVTADLVEIQQNAAAGELADQLIAAAASAPPIRTRRAGC